MIHCELMTFRPAPTLSPAGSGSQRRRQTDLTRGKSVRDRPCGGRARRRARRGDHGRMARYGEIWPPHGFRAQPRSSRRRGESRAFACRAGPRGQARFGRAAIGFISFGPWRLEEKCELLAPRGASALPRSPGRSRTDCGDGEIWTPAGLRANALRPPARRKPCFRLSRRASRAESASDERWTWIGADASVWQVSRRVRRT